mmetsp:Transcript_9372/g.14123  ORF Transcript_9372/g.14123 Transcript_9372/m.14123 type:complete len:462 (-) Transcript_9372:74-1459(-)
MSEVNKSATVDSNEKVKKAHKESVEERLEHLKIQEDSVARKNRLKVIQADQNSHLFSAKSFEQLELKPELHRGILSMGFEKPSSIQEMALPLILKEPRENLIAQAQSGSGKTVAFCLGMLSQIDTSKKCTQAMVLTPTRELAVQCVTQTLLPMAKYLDPSLTVMLALAGTKIMRGAQINDHIVVGTPGTVEMFLKKRSLNVNSIKIFILDEADQMLDDSFGGTIQKIKSYIIMPHQSLLFSATFPPSVIEFAKEIILPPINEIRLASDEELVLEEITQLWVDLRSTSLNRTELLKDLYTLLQMGQSIVFCSSKRSCNDVTKALQEVNFSCSNLHGNLEGYERDICMEDFRLGKKKVLITTNVLARGVDIPAVTLVVNYDMPELHYSSTADFESYLHRIGRTGRFGRSGVVINLVHNEISYQLLKEIENHFSPSKKMIKPAPTDVEELEELVSKVFSGKSSI